MNTIILAGRLTKDIELKKIGDKEISLASFSIANNYKIRDEKKTNFFNLEAWGKTAELIANYFGKGDLISIVGKAREDKFEDKDGNKRSVVKFVVDILDFDTCQNKKNSSRNNYTENEISPEKESEADDLPF